MVLPQEKLYMLCIVYIYKRPVAMVPISQKFVFHSWRRNAQVFLTQVKLFGQG